MVADDNDYKAAVKDTDMPEDLVEKIIGWARMAFEECHIEKDIATAIKQEADSQLGPTWHCVVGRNFGSSVSSASGGHLCFYLGHVAVLVFKAA